MSEREVREAATACPFVAFDDDRDHRADRPDHRHRCFAEVRPATRAAAHQEAYCLSARFATCPTFMDWAAREAARVRPSGTTSPRGSAPSARGAAAAGAAAAGAAAAGAAAAGAAGPAGESPSDVEPGSAPSREWSPNRRADREWASPPPWMPSAEAAAADRGAPDMDEARAFDEPPEASDAIELSDAAPPAFVAAVPPRTRSESRPPSQPVPPTRRPSWDEPPELPDDDEDPAGPPRRFGPAGGHSRERIPVDPDAPTWERPRRFEAYPTLRTRTGLKLPGGSPLILAAIGIFALAIALFFVPPMLLGLGGGDAAATPTPSASAEASPSAELTPTPAPTPVTYVVKSGDTMSKIAAEFGVSLDALIEANRETVPNPDQVQVGQTLIIPTAPPEEIPGASPSPAASPSP